MHASAVSLALSLGLILGRVGVAPAAQQVLSTAPVVGDQVGCVVTNVGSADVGLIIDVVGISGSAPQTSQLPPSITPQGLSYQVFFDTAGPGTVAFCRFTITQGLADDLRAGACGISFALGGKCASFSDAR